MAQRGAVHTFLGMITPVLEPKREPRTGVGLTVGDTPRTYEAAPRRKQRRIAPAQLSHELRVERDPDLQRRRWLVGLSFVGAALGKVVSLYQMGIIRRLPDLPSKYFDATKVDASDYAYKRMQTPDALLMVASYATTAILAGAGGRDRAETNPALPILMAAKTVADATIALKLGREEWKENKALCGYCQAATLVSLTSVALALPEALRAVRRIGSPPLPGPVPL